MVDYRIGYGHSIDAHAIAVAAQRHKHTILPDTFS